jgi:hypothetical protein
MAINRPTKAEFESQLKQKLNDIRTALDNAAELRALIYSFDATDAGDTTQAKAGMATEYSYSAEELTNVFNAVNAADQLRKVANAQATVGAVDDFFFFAKRVWGFGPIRR